MDQILAAVLGWTLVSFIVSGIVGRCLARSSVASNVGPSATPLLVPGVANVISASEARSRRPLVRADAR